MAKFGRRYVMQVQGQLLPHSIFYPLTCKFDITQNNFAMANAAEFSLYGLSELSRKDIYFDPYFSKAFIPIKFFAGYDSESDIPLVFDGNVITAFTVREGSELVTRISALDGGFGIDQGKVPAPAGTLPKNWQFTPTVKQVMGYLPQVQVGEVLVTPEPKPGTRAVIFAEKPWDVLQKYKPADTDLFIFNGVVNMIGQNVTLPAKGISELSADTGLLNIPIRQGYTVTCQSLFEPNFVIGQPLHLTSKLTPWVNGQYKVIGLHHSGTISGVESGEARTDLTLLSSKAELA